ncbi:hypothetical protein TWF281_003240 [Arthrobotrys megalospora]
MASIGDLIRVEIPVALADWQNFTDEDPDAAERVTTAIHDLGVVIDYKGRFDIGNKEERYYYFPGADLIHNNLQVQSIPFFVQQSILLQTGNGPAQVPPTAAAVPGANPPATRLTFTIDDNYQYGALDKTHPDFIVLHDHSPGTIYQQRFLIPGNDKATGLYKF